MAHMPKLNYNETRVRLDSEDLLMSDRVTIWLIDPANRTMSSLGPAGGMHTATVRDPSAGIRPWEDGLDVTRQSGKEDGTYATMDKFRSDVRPDGALRRNHDEAPFLSDDIAEAQRDRLTEFFKQMESEMSEMLEEEAAALMFQKGTYPLRRGAGAIGEESKIQGDTEDGDLVVLENAQNTGTESNGSGGSLLQTVLQTANEWFKGHSET